MVIEELARSGPQRGRQLYLGCRFAPPSARRYSPIELTIRQKERLSAFRFATTTPQAFSALLLLCRAERVRLRYASAGRALQEKMGRPSWQYYEYRSLLHRNPEQDIDAKAVRMHQETRFDVGSGSSYRKELLSAVAHSGGSFSPGSIFLARRMWCKKAEIRTLPVPFVAPSLKRGTGPT
jgi:hypothetical protein